MHSSKTYKKLVVITSRFPYPLEKGDKLRAYQQIKLLSKHFEVYLICTSEKKVKDEYIQELSPYCKQIDVFPISWAQRISGVALQAFNGKPFQVGYFYQYSIQKKINRILEEVQPDHIYCQLIRAAEYVKNYHKCNKTIDYMDALSKGVERRAKASKFPVKLVIESEHRRLLSYENSIFEYFENHTIISEQDKQYIFHKNKEQIKVIANGVDASFFEQKEQEKTTDIVFIGNMSYQPNITAAKFIVEEILPTLPHTTKVKIAGSSPSKDVLRLASEQVEVTGFVEDIKAAYLSAHIFVAPMFLGTGLQNKLLEAMALGIPCITTNLANNALGAKADESILISDTVNSFTENITQLLNDSELRAKIAKKGQDFVKENYNWDKVTAPLIQLLSN